MSVAWRSRSTGRPCSIASRANWTRCTAPTTWPSTVSRGRRAWAWGWPRCGLDESTERRVLSADSRPLPIYSAFAGVRWWELTAWTVVLVAAVVLRLAALGDRPLGTD